MRRRLTIVLGIICCASPRDTRTDSTALVPPLPAGATPHSALSDDEWFATADSVLRVYLSRSQYLVPRSEDPRIRDCPGDMASENPPMLAAAARMRVVGHDTIGLDSAIEYDGSNREIRTTAFRVEVTSAAILTPTWMLEPPIDSTVPGHDPYIATVGVHVDTLEIPIADLAPLKPRWSICDPTRPHAGIDAFWSFMNAGADWMTVVRWTPADASWETVRALAQSLAR